MPPKQRKIALMGFRSVGKSSLTIQFVEGQFVDSYDPTIENTFYKSVKYKGEDFLLKLIDTAGQDEYSIFPHTYAMDIHGYCLVYSINNLKSFEVAKIIYDKLLDMTGKIQVPILLVGNKVDLHLERCVTTADGAELAQYMNAQFCEVSAKENSTVNGIFNTMISSIEDRDRGRPEMEPIEMAEAATAINPSTTKNSSSSSNNNKKDKCVIS